MYLIFTPEIQEIQNQISKIHQNPCIQVIHTQTITNCSTGTLYTPRFPFFKGELITKWAPKSLLQNAKKTHSYSGVVEVENVRIRVATKWVKKN